MRKVNRPKYYAEIQRLRLIDDELMELCFNDNIEFQRDNSGAVPERARYNSSMIDVNRLDKGGDFTELPDVYVIFITEHDVLGGGLPMYTIERVIAETGKPFGDRSHIVYVNGRHRDAGTALGKLVHDIFCERPEDMYNSALAERVRYFKEDAREVKKVSALTEKVTKDARMYTQKDIAQRMLEAGKLALSEIAKYTGLSVSTVRRMAKKLEAAQAAQA